MDSWGTRLVAFFVLGLFMCTSCFSLVEGQQTRSQCFSNSCQMGEKFEAFNETYFVFGKRSVEETFFMENGSEVIGFGFKRVSRYFTGYGDIELYDEEEPEYYGGADTCTYLFGIIILPWDLWVSDEYFTPGRQTLKLGIQGFGRVTVIIYGQR